MVQGGLEGGQPGGEQGKVHWREGMPGKQVKTRSVIFVSHTEGGELIRRLREDMTGICMLCISSTEKLFIRYS